VAAIVFVGRFFKSSQPSAVLTVAMALCRLKMLASSWREEASPSLCWVMMLGDSPQV